MTDEQYLRRAVELATKSEEEVGCACIIVLDGEIIAKEVNSQNVDQVAVHHAEVKAVYQANRKTGKRKLESAIAYCGCEPCAVCVAALSYAKISRIVYAKGMAELFPDDLQSKLDIHEFASHLNFVPKIEQMVV